MLWSEFDAITDTTVINPALRKALDKLACNKDELLKVLKYPFIPLTNNGSERDIRTYVIKRKINTIPYLSELIKAKAQSATSP